jgi:hypothetical protein
MCDREYSGFHVLFECPVFQSERAQFLNVVGQDFTFDALRSDCRAVCLELVRTGKIIFDRVRALSAV